MHKPKVEPTVQEPPMMREPIKKLNTTDMYRLERKLEYLSLLNERYGKFQHKDREIESRMNELCNSIENDLGVHDYNATDDPKEVTIKIDDKAIDAIKYATGGIVNQATQVRI